MTPAIVATNASKLFLDGAVVAFRTLSIEIRTQEVRCIVGSSGCGKTTFLRCVAVLTEISENTRVAAQYFHRHGEQSRPIPTNQALAGNQSARGG